MGSVVILVRPCASNSKETQQKYRLGMACIKILWQGWGILNRVYRYDRLFGKSCSFGLPDLESDCVSSSSLLSFLLQATRCLVRSPTDFISLPFNSFSSVSDNREPLSEFSQNGVLIA